MNFLSGSGSPVHCRLKVVGKEMWQILFWNRLKTGLKNKQISPAQNIPPLLWLPDPRKHKVDNQQPVHIVLVDLVCAGLAQECVLVRAIWQQGEIRLRVVHGLALVAVDNSLIVQFSHSEEVGTRHKPC